MIFAAAPATATASLSTYSPTGPAPCSPAMISQRDALDAQVKYDLEKVQSALATNKVALYSTTFMRFAANMRTLARINGTLDTCMGAALAPRFSAMFSSYSTQRKAVYIDLVKAEAKLTDLWLAHNYAGWLQQLRFTAGLHRQLARLDAIIAGVKPQPTAPPPPPNGSGFTTAPQDNHHEVDDGYHANPPIDPSSPVTSTSATPPATSALPPGVAPDGSGSPQFDPLPTSEPVIFAPLWKRAWFWPAVGAAAIVTGAVLLRR